MSVGVKTDVIWLVQKIGILGAGVRSSVGRYDQGRFYKGRRAQGQAWGSGCHRPELKEQGFVVENEQGVFCIWEQTCVTGVGGALGGL